MAYIALYRKWRPGSFKDLVGQDHISRTLSNAILTGKIGHAYLFAGPRGTGKTSTAKILAKALNCEKGPTPDPCNVCENCKKINEGSSMDVFEIDAASNRGIDEIRDLRETVKFAPVDGRYKVYIIDEVHMLTSEAFNALLKTLEEPPAHVVFILATTEAHKVPATIQSRCQRYDFKRITIEHILERLRLIVKETGIAAEEEALQLIARQADGGMRDALSILDQCSALSEDQITGEKVRQILGLVGHEWIWKITEAIAGKKSMDILQVIDDLLRDGKDLKQVLAELILHLRALMVYQAAGLVSQEDAYQAPEEILCKQAAFFTQTEVMQMIQRLNEALLELKWTPQPRIAVEVALLSFCQSGERAMHISGKESGQSAPPMDDRFQQLEAKIAQLTAALAAGGQPPSAAVSVRAAPKVGTTAAPAMMPTVDAGAPVLSAGEVTREGQALWQQLLQSFKQAGKDPVLACLNNGRFAGSSERQFFIAFKSKMLKQLAERNYTRMIEPELLKLTGKNLQLVCTLEEGTRQAAPPPVKPVKKKALPEVPLPTEPKVAVDFDHLADEDQERLQAAVNVFGDYFVEVGAEKKDK